MNFVLLLQFIAMMGNTYQELQLQATDRWRMQRAQIILEMELSYFRLPFTLMFGPLSKQRPAHQIKSKGCWLIQVESREHAKTEGWEIYSAASGLTEPSRVDVGAPLLIKCNLAGEIRCRAVPADEAKALSYAQLCASIVAAFRLDTDANLNLVWWDKYGDSVTIDSDPDVFACTAAALRMPEPLASILVEICESPDGFKRVLGHRSPKVPIGFRRDDHLHAPEQVSFSSATTGPTSEVDDELSRRRASSELEVESVLDALAIIQDALEEPEPEVIEPALETKQKGKKRAKGQVLREKQKLKLKEEREETEATTIVELPAVVSIRL